jgi:hypothetical protein
MIPKEQLKALLVLHEQRKAQQKADRILNRALAVALLALLVLLAYRQMAKAPVEPERPAQIHLPQS